MEPCPSLEFKPTARLSCSRLCHLMYLDIYLMCKIYIFILIHSEYLFRKRLAGGYSRKILFPFCQLYWLLNPCPVFVDQSMYTVFSVDHSFTVVSLDGVRWPLYPYLLLCVYATY